MPLKRKQPAPMDESPGLGALVAYPELPPAKFASSPALKQSSPGLRQTPTATGPPTSARVDAHGSTGPPAPTHGLHKLPSLSAMFGPFDPPHASPQSHASSSPSQSAATPATTA